MSDESSSIIPKEGVQTVTSLGNSWIICRSKSHLGRIYYFNTLTGEAAWNLSDQEIEKARARTKILESQSGGKFEGCPEPKEPPNDNHNLKSPENTQIYIPSRVYNKQIINNQFSNEKISPIVASQCAKCSSVTTIDHIGTNLPVPHNCNPNVWAIPPHHQIVIAPTPSNMLNQLQASVSVACNNDQRVCVQNTSLPLSHRFNQINSIKTTNKHIRYSNGFNKFTPRQHQNTFGQRNGSSPYYRKFNRCTDSNDLRQRLTARRKSSNAWNNYNEISNYDREEDDKSATQRIQIIKPSQEHIAPTDADDLWLKEVAIVQGTGLLINVTHLKQLVTTGATTWYIVTDTDVLLNHIKLINYIVGSDEMCQLMVPDFVMADLQNKSRADDSQLLTRAHHVLQILSQQFTAGKAVMGKDPRSDGNVGNFCYKLSTQDHDLVLISNNIQWSCYKNNSIIALSVQELKDLLSKAVRSENEMVDDCNIQITIPNTTFITDDGDSNDVSSLQTISVGTQYDNNKNKTGETQTSSTMNMRRGQITNCTLDVGIQTDFDIPQMSYFTNVNSTGVNTEMKDEERKDDINFNKDVVVSDMQPKRKEIRLKRNLSNLSLEHLSDNNIEKKQFKWRRKKTTSVSNANATKDQSTSHSSNSSNVEGRPNTSQTLSDLSRVESLFVPESRSNCFEPVDSSETSSSCFIQKSVNEKVIIEETSTSGIISNSASNVDSESMPSLRPNEHMYNKIIQDEQDCKCVMFEVENPNMEEHLRMRSDEWVSRFVQIMEEVLTQILTQNPTFLINRTLPPPWTIHEATECIKKKFEHDSDVKDASDRLTKLLFYISDGRGKIRIDLKPSQFMKMYSYGVYLVDALQSILNDSEDLQTAADSLSKLLSDIQDSSIHTDTFMDHSHTLIADISEPSIGRKSHETVHDITKSDEKESPDLKSPTVADKNTQRKKYNLRSNQKKRNEDEEVLEQPVKFIRKIDIESNFFSSLSLKKKQDSEFGTNSPIPQNTLSAPQEKKTPESANNADTENKDDAPSDKPSEPEPKFVRNFSKCLEFEELLKNKDKQTVAFNTAEYPQDDEDGYTCYDDYEYGYYDFEEEIDEMETYESIKEDEIQTDTTAVDKNGNTKYEWIIRNLVNEIQGTFLEVHSFCSRTSEELSVSKTLGVQRKYEICEKAEKTLCHMDTLWKSVNRILSREETDYENSMKNVLKEAGIHLDDNKSNEYRHIIAQYSSQANILIDALNSVIEAVKC